MEKTKQAEINIKTMFRQCGIKYDNEDNLIFDKFLLLEWFENELQKKDYTIYDTI